MTFSSIFSDASGIADFLVKLAPAASIVAAILAARITYKNNRKLNAETIAKNHYRQMLEIFLQNSDILLLGANAKAFEELKLDIPRYRRYRMLFAIMSFAMQELYLSVDLKREKNWEHMIRVFASLFKYFILSEADFPPYMQQSRDPRFLKFLLQTARDHEHPVAGMNVSQFRF